MGGLIPPSGRGGIAVGMAGRVGTAAVTIGWAVMIGCILGRMMVGKDTGIAMCPAGTMGDMVTIVGPILETIGGASTTTPGWVGRTPEWWLIIPPIAIAAAAALA